MPMEQVKFDIVLVFRNLKFRFNSAHSILLALDMIFLKRRISKNIVFKQKTKLIDKTTSKHFQTFIYLFLFQQISENGKKDIERKCSALYEKVTDGSWESKKRE